jgi:hypothetical protein
MRVLSHDYESGKLSNPQKIARFAGRAEDGPCLTDAARVAAPDALSVDCSRYAATRTMPRRSSRPK